MKEHKGMRPQDIVILLKIIALGEQSWYKKDLALQLSISNSEISESLKRSVTGELLRDNKSTVKMENLLEFLVYGLRHVFPAVPGSLTRGMPTAYSAPVLAEKFVVDDPYVWSDSYNGESDFIKGIAIPPLYDTVPKACRQDFRLYELLALSDSLRIGERREQVVQLMAHKMYSLASADAQEKYQ